MAYRKYAVVAAPLGSVVPLSRALVGVINVAAVVTVVGGASVLFLASLGLGGLSGVLPAVAAPLTIALGVVLSVILFVWTFHTLGNHSPGWRAHLPGAVAAAVGLELLKFIV